MVPHSASHPGRSAKALLTSLCTKRDTMTSAQIKAAPMIPAKIASTIKVIFVPFFILLFF